jgi:hypothetical protein
MRPTPSPTAESGSGAAAERGSVAEVAVVAEPGEAKADAGEPTLSILAC